MQTTKDDGGRQCRDARDSTYTPRAPRCRSWGRAASGWGHIWIYDTTFVDNLQSIAVSNDNVTRLDFVNNAFIQYGLDVGYVYNGNGYDVSGWNVDNNHFYGGALPTTAPWSTTMRTGDPRLPKTSEWRALVDAPSEADATPQAGSALIDQARRRTTIASATAQDQSSFVVQEAGFLRAGDALVTEGRKLATVTALSYETNGVEVSPAIDVVRGEGLALSYAGARPDVGAYEAP